jgi:hypothetical protein
MSYWHNPLVLTRPYKLLAGPTLTSRSNPKSTLADLILELIQVSKISAALPHCTRLSKNFTNFYYSYPRPDSSSCCCPQIHSPRPKPAAKPCRQDACTTTVDTPRFLQQTSSSPQAHQLNWDFGLPGYLDQRGS